jgi:hypothetical protein
MVRRREFGVRIPSLGFCIAGVVVVADLFELGKVPSASEFLVIGNVFRVGDEG